MITLVRLRCYIISHRYLICLIIPDCLLFFVHIIIYHRWYLDKQQAARGHTPNSAKMSQVLYDEKANAYIEELLIKF